MFLKILPIMKIKRVNDEGWMMEVEGGEAEAQKYMGMVG